jgi:hypothetical protein
MMYSSEPIEGVIIDLYLYNDDDVRDECRIKVCEVLWEMGCCVYGPLGLDDYDDILVYMDDICEDGITRTRFFVHTPYKQGSGIDHSAFRKEWEHLEKSGKTS